MRGGWGGNHLKCKFSHLASALILVWDGHMISSQLIILGSRDVPSGLFLHHKNIIAVQSLGECMEQSPTHDQTEPKAKYYSWLFNDTFGQEVAVT